MHQKFIRSLFIRTAVLLAFIAMIIITIDPFFHYHGPMGSLKTVLTEREYQMTGSIQHLNYDSIILGSSVAENYNNQWFDEGFECTTIKAIRASGPTADLMYYLNKAYTNHTIKNVFYSLDTFALITDSTTSFKESGFPMYLLNGTGMDDISYVLNKDVLLEKIPYMLAYSYLVPYHEGDSYSWYQWKEGLFNNKEALLERYVYPSNRAEMKEKTYYEEQLNGNIKLMKEQIEAHSETKFFLLFPPYSMLWWNDMYYLGDTDAYLYCVEKAIEDLVDYENVKLYYFQNDREIILDLNKYMDTIHFSREVNQEIADCIIADQGRLRKETYCEQLEDMKALAYEIPTLLSEKLK
ncbi:MAG TPA: SGNH/GDSL hydrolase family protein [Lachnospiraceae bacterium]|nr:SGNH/GDSL hydrolase family protein [Lachnospiraceae bacterium]